MSFVQKFRYLCLEPLIRRQMDDCGITPHHKYFTKQRRHGQLDLQTPSKSHAQMVLSPIYTTCSHRGGCIPTNFSYMLHNGRVKHLVVLTIGRLATSWRSIHLPNFTECKTNLSAAWGEAKGTKTPRDECDEKIACSSTPSKAKLEGMRLQGSLVLQNAMMHAGMRKGEV